MSQDNIKVNFQDTKEGHIQYLMNRVNDRQRKVEELLKQHENITEALSRMQEANKRDLIRVEELRLLRDIRDGRIILLDSQTNNELKVAVFHNAA